MEGVKKMPTILIDKQCSNERYHHTLRRKKKKAQEWPDEDIANLYAKKGLQYKKKSAQLFNTTSYRRFSSQSILEEKRVTDLLKQAPEEVDRLYEMPFGELKASQRVLLHRKRSLQDIAMARRNAEIEIKFRETYEKDMPKEFAVMPDPAQVFSEQKAIDVIDAIRD